MAGLDNVGTLRSSSNAAGIEPGANAAPAGAIERISARHTANILRNATMLKVDIYSV